MGVIIRGNKIPALRRNLRGLLAGVVRDAAAAIQTDAQSLAPVETGSLRNSIYVVTDAGGDYASSVAAAEAVNPDVKILPEADTPPPLQAKVCAAASHGLGQEVGTVTHGPQPFMAPAAVQNSEAFRRAVAAAIREAARG